jgi:hypothetical protein
MLSEYDRQNVGRILGGEGDWFTAQLLRLIAKADGGNRALLTLGFPAEVQLVRDYQAGKIVPARP